MLVEAATSGLIAFVALISAAFTKIMIMFLTVLMVFLFIPQSRVTSMLAVAVVSSFLGGTMIHLFSEGSSWEMVSWVSIAFGAGLSVFPFLMIFSSFYKLLSEDTELHKTIYDKLKNFFTKKILSWLDTK